MRRAQQLLFLTLVVTTLRAFAVPLNFESSLETDFTTDDSQTPSHFEVDPNILSTVDITPVRPPQLNAAPVPEPDAIYHHLVTPRLAVTLDLDRVDTTPGLSWGATYLRLGSSAWHWEWALDVNQESEPMPSVGFKYILELDEHVRPFAKLGARTRWISKEQLATLINLENAQLTTSIGIQDRMWKRTSIHIEFEVATGSKYHHALLFAGASYPF